MIPAERLERASELLEQALQELDAAEPDVPPYALDSLRFLRAEVKVSRRRIENCRRVLSSSRIR